jgi:anaerobic ribonucleoside-triphosphate reductase activating protein
LCDVIIDGRYVETERDVSLPFRGSRNQRLIDVSATLATQKVVTMQLSML